MRAGSLLDGPGPVLDPDEEPDADLLSLILNQRLPMLPVVQGGRLVGTLTLGDFAGHLIDAAQDDTVAEFMVGDTSWWPTDL